MKTIALREEVKKYIDRADERFLKMVFALSKEYDDTSVVGYTTKGKPITRVELRSRLKDASKRVKSGDYLTQEELEKEIENW